MLHFFNFSNLCYKSFCLYEHPGIAGRRQFSYEKQPADIAKGIVKWYVEVYDEIQEAVALATILTMSKKKQQE